MRNIALVLLLACTPAFAQNAPNNAAAEALKQRFLQLRLLNPPKVVQLGPQMFAVQTPACAVPLREATPPGTRDKMPSIQTPEPGKSDFSLMPAPPCGDPSFRPFVPLQIKPVNPVPVPPAPPQAPKP